MSCHYVVVTTDYPTTYGCNRGVSWSRADLIVRSNRERSDETYSSREDAVKAARKKRNRSEWFMDECEPDDDDDDDDDDRSRGYNFQFTNSDQPPYDSADLQNWDNDSEIRIEVMTVEEYEEQEASDEKFLCKARMQRRYNATVEEKIMQMQIKDAGRVYYPQRPNPNLTVKAELEVLDYEVGDDGKEEKEGDYNLKPVEIPKNASSIKTLMYKGGKQSLSKFMKDCRAMKEGDDHTATQQEQESIGLLRILAACKSLEELHLQSSTFSDIISPAFISKMLSAAPHLQQSLKVLSLRRPFEIQPDALPSIGKFKMLERLDISHTFSSEYYHGDYFDDDDSTGGKAALPYDEPLLECVKSIQELKRLDIGNGDGESQRYLFDYMLSTHALVEVAEGVTLTMENHSVPEDWSSSERKDKAHHEALVKIYEDENEDEDIRGMAREEAKSI